jgi:hypothetical protein
MKTKKHFILVAVAIGFILGLLAVGLLKTAINNPPVVQASNKETCPTGKIAYRCGFKEGVSLVQDIQYERLRTLRDKKDILAGLERVEVLVEGLHACAEKYGLTQQLLHTDAELRLRMHGINVGTNITPKHKGLDEKTTTDTAHSSIRDWRHAIDAGSDEDFLQFAKESVRRDLFETSRPGRLYINVNTIVFEESGRAVFAVQVELKEGASVFRNGAWCSAPTWDTADVGACPSNNLREYVRECVRDDVDEFINDYLAANPKDRSSGESR